MSATYEAIGSIRTMPACFGMGEAVGTAIGLLNKDKLSIDNLNVKELQKQLVKQGVYLENYFE